MTIERLVLKNFKTYTNLDIDLSIEKNRPIILIGGTNGGGKTTFFEAVHAALYGLNIHKEWQFLEFVNVANKQKLEQQKIILTIHFTNTSEGQQQEYQLQRIYLTHEGSVREHVQCKVGGHTFQYGPETPSQEKIKAEREISKVIQASLPESLSRYFLFDAMEAGSLLRREQLQRVIKDNVETVMGFDRYLQLERAAAIALGAYKQQQIKQEYNKKAYEKWLKKQADYQQKIVQEEQKLKEALDYASLHEQTKTALEDGKNKDTLLKEKVNYTNRKLQRIADKEEAYSINCVQFIQDLDTHIGLPMLVKQLSPMLHTVLEKQQAPVEDSLKRTRIKTIAQKLLNLLAQRKLLKQPISVDELLPSLLPPSKSNTETPLLIPEERIALKRLLELPKQTPYSRIAQQQKELQQNRVEQEEQLRYLNLYQSKLSKEDFSLLDTYKANNSIILACRNNIRKLEQDLKELNTKMEAFEQEKIAQPDEKQQELQQLKTFFERFALQLLERKKENIEKKMKQGLNQMLVAYKGMIDRVELPNDLKNLTFKLFHKNGNEISLNQLNTASKQVVVQCLLKALHEHGNYHPPVIIDTVMGVLDKQSRATMLEYFLPKLAHQTILLSSDSEIQPSEDFTKIEPYVAKTYTLQRDIEKQATSLAKGYFN